ncbi:hypothetical protein [Phenylobacterium sp.]|uniref:hypothetical protein n=1 Tax=Phenylobacterium sp. TaxID=1871053 RepID=UPI003521B412
MTPYKQAACVTGTYTDRDGNEKKRYVNVGTLFQYEDGGFALKLDSIPVGQGWNGFVSFFDLKPRDGGQAGGGQRTSQQASKPREDFSADLDDEIPF